MPKIFASRLHPMQPDCCFVIMPFKASLDDVYQVVKRAVEEHGGCECIRADEIAQSTPITDDIYEQIQRARFLVADLSGRNPNVYYELGLSHALDKEVILLGQTRTIPFDVRGIRYLKYSPSDLKTLYEKLTKYIKKSLQTVPDAWRTDVTQNGPDVRISHLEWPKRIVALNRPIRLRVHARNFLIILSLRGQRSKDRRVRSDRYTSWRDRAILEIGDCHSEIPDS